MGAPYIYDISHLRVKYHVVDWERYSDQLAGWRTYESSCDCQQPQQKFFYSASIQCVPRAKGQGMTLTTRLHVASRLRMCGGVPLFLHMSSNDAQGQVQIGKYKLSYLSFFCIREFLISRSYSTSLGRFTFHVITTTEIRNSKQSNISCYVLCTLPKTVSFENV